MKTGKPKNDKKIRLDWMAVLMAVVYPGIYAFILAFVFYLLYIASDRIIFLVLIGLTALIYLVAVFLLIRYFRKSSNPSACPSRSRVVNYAHDSNEDDESAFTAGFMGGALLHQLIRDW